MNADLLEQLLYEEESDSLDFKRDQYRFIKADDADKGELLKDILAFANSWCRSDAYMLIGIDEVKGGRSEIVAITEHLDDADLQQFVNQKTNRPIQFAYKTFRSAEGRIGIIHVPRQKRPFYVNKDYGRVKARIVYVRRGSSTDEAKPDEIAAMGSMLEAKAEAPALDLSFANAKTCEAIGTFITVRSGLLNFDPNEIPDYATSRSYVQATLSRENRHFYRQWADYEKELGLMKGFRLSIRNLGSVLLSNVNIKLTCELHPHFSIKDELPLRPKRRIDAIEAPIGLRDLRNTLGKRRSIRVEQKHDRVICSCDMQNIQPKAEEVSDDLIYLGAHDNAAHTLEATVFADNLEEPIRFALTVNIETRELPLDIEALVERLNRTRS